MNQEYLERCFWGGLVVIFSPIFVLGWSLIVIVDGIKKFKLGDELDDN